MKLSSPYLNVMFIIGISMIYLLVVILGLDDNLVSVSVMSGFCQATVWIGVIAFTLVYGVVLAKTFKVFFIFKNLQIAKPDQKKVSNIYYKYFLHLEHYPTVMNMHKSLQLMICYTSTCLCFMLLNMYLLVNNPYPNPHEAVAVNILPRAGRLVTAV